MPRPLSKQSQGRGRALLEDRLLHCPMRSRMASNIPERAGGSLNFITPSSVKRQVIQITAGERVGPYTGCVDDLKETVMAMPPGYTAIAGSERPRPASHRLVGPVDANEVIGITLSCVRVLAARLSRASTTGGPCGRASAAAARRPSTRRLTERRRPTSIR